jgi:hypothetical protein
VLFPSSGLKNKPGKYPARRKLQAKLPASCWLLALTYSSTMKMEAICSSEVLMNLYRSTQHYIPEDLALRGREIFCCIGIWNFFNTHLSDYWLNHPAAI